jgi:asparagine synthase (glutamine-hydrolysing)
MCGIAGILGVPRELASKAAPRMLAAMRHRGPDDSGIEIVHSPRDPDHPITLIHTRLAILDLSAAGRQPMCDQPRSPRQSPNWIVFNGEIFNYQELHPDLTTAGWPCRTRSDTEALLNAYRVWGEACVSRLRGMFAFCIVDANRGTAWFCRDRLGIKPLYLIRPKSGGLLFASEVRTLLAAGPEWVPPIVDPAAVESFLAQGAVSGPRSIIQNVALLGPGQSLTTDWLGTPLTSRTYWAPPFAPNDAADDLVPHAKVVNELNTTLHQAVKLRLLADVPLGLFLSGGVDSSAVAAVATEQTDSLRTVNIGFDQAAYDETSAAREVAESLGTDHVSLRLSSGHIVDEFPRALAAVDQPTVDGFNTYFVSQATRRAGLKVALSGLGGDELFGGYASFHDVPRAVRWRRRLGALGCARDWLARIAKQLGRRGAAKAAELLIRKPSLLHMYFLRRELFLPTERRVLFPLPEGCDPLTGMPNSVIEELSTRAHGLDAFNQISLFELSTYMRNMLLRDADVFSMAHGLELRVPLLDHRFVEQAVQLPGARKRPDPRPKPLLIDAVGPHLPRLVHRRPKQGFTFPWPHWLRGPLKYRVTQALQNRDVWRSLGLNPAAPTVLWRRFREGDRRIAALQILALVVLEGFTSRHGLRHAA